MCLIVKQPNHDVYEIGMSGNDLESFIDPTYYTGYSDRGSKFIQIIIYMGY